MLNDMEPPKLLSFPCDYPIKVMMRSGTQIRAAVDSAIAKHAGPGAAAGATERPSAKGNFIGVTYTILARDEPHIAALFADVKDLPGVLMVL